MRTIDAFLIIASFIIAIIAVYFIAGLQTFIIVIVLMIMAVFSELYYLNTQRYGE